MHHSKEILKPTIGKIILFLFLFFIFVPFIRYDNGIRCFTTPCDSDTIGSILMWLFSKRYAGTVYDIDYLNLTIGLIASYIIACLLSFVFSKRKL